MRQLFVWSEQNSLGENVMSQRFHVNEDKEKIEKCQSEKCDVALEGKHFQTAEEAQIFFDKKMKEKYGALPKNNN